MLVEYVKDNYYARLHDPSYHRYRERYFSILLNIKFRLNQWCVKCRSRRVLVEYVKENYYARFHDPSYHRYKERHFSILLDIKF